MKFTKTVEVPATTKTELDHYKCDLCGKTTENNSRWPSTIKVDQPRWSLGVDKNVRETTVKMEVGDRYPEGSWGDVTQFDICTDCFITKLIPWFESQGAKPREEEWDW